MHQISRGGVQVEHYGAVILILRCASVSMCGHQPAAGVLRGVNSPAVAERVSKGRWKRVAGFFAFVSCVPAAALFDFFFLRDRRTLVAHFRVGHAMQNTLDSQRAQ